MLTQGKKFLVWKCISMTVIMSHESLLFMARFPIFLLRWRGGKRVVENFLIAVENLSSVLHVSVSF